MSIRDIAEPVSLNDGTAMPGYGFWVLRRAR